jgi:tripartite-type tricarboxylate transporter receptor subunit TctC
MDFPKSYVRIVSGFAAGGSVDSQARPLAAELSRIWKQQAIIENKPGAGTSIAAGYVANSQPDGYTLFFAGPSLVVAQHFQPNLRFDAIESFSPISTVATSPFFVLVNPALKVDTIAQLIALARSQPGKLTFGSSGIGTGMHLSAELMAASTGISVVHVPFNGTAPVITALLGGFIDFAFGDISSLPAIRAGSLKALAVTSTRRLSTLPEVPTLDETVAKGYEFTYWSALLAPANTPPEIVKFLNESVVQALSAPDLVKLYEAQGLIPSPSTPQEARKLLISERSKSTNILRKAGIIKK